MDTKYGRLTNGRIEYAPSSLDTEDGVKMNPSEASYLAAWWKKIVDVKPTAEAGYRVEVSGWQESEDSLTCVYKVVAGDAPVSGPRVFSKLKLVAALKEADKWVLVKTWIEGIPRRARCARAVGVGLPEHEVRTPQGPQGPHTIVVAVKSEVIKPALQTGATRRASVSSASASNRPPEHVR